MMSLMAQQPNIEIPLVHVPRKPLSSPAPRGWSTDDHPGVSDYPDARPFGGTFGTPAPDAGYAYRIIRHFEKALPDALVDVLASLITARASLYGRAPIPEDLEVARFLCGMFEQAPRELIIRRIRWMKATRRESSKGRTAVSEVELALLAENPARVKLAVALSR